MLANAIYGWFGAGPAAGAADTLDRMVATQVLDRSTPIQRRHLAQGTIAIAGKSNTACLVEFGARKLLLTGHPQFDDASVLLRIEEVGRLLLLDFERHGVASFAKLRGDFTLALIDASSGAGWLAVDRIGMGNLVYAQVRGKLVFASSLDALGAHPDCARSIDSQSVYDYLFFHVVPGPDTIFSGQRRVPPANALIFDGTHATTQPYWTLRFEEEARPDFRALKTRFVAVLEQATRASGYGARSATFLSGGTDSSTVTGMLARTSGETAAFSIGFDAAGYDEMQYARLAARHFRARHHEYYVTPTDVVTAIPRIVGAFDQPFGNASAIPTYYCALRAREHGIERMLAGDGGDELFGGNERYAKHLLLGHYHQMPASLRQAVLEPLLLGPAFVAKVPLLRKLRRYVEQARLPMPQRYESYNLLEHLEAVTVLEQRFLGGVDVEHPHALMREAHAPFAQASLINQMLGIDLRFILADGDLPKVTRTCALAGMDVAFPMLDAPVIDLSARLPSDYKLRATRLRWFFKEALRDFLPQSVITKKKQGFGLPVGAWLMSHRPLLDLALSGVDALRPHGIVSARFVDDLKRRLLPAHPAYYGTMLWVLMMLGLWLQSRRS